MEHISIDKSIRLFKMKKCEYIIVASELQILDSGGMVSTGWFPAVFSLTKDNELGECIHTSSQASFGSSKEAIDYMQSCIDKHLHMVRTMCN